MLLALLLALGPVEHRGLFLHFDAGFGGFHSPIANPSGSWWSPGSGLGLSIGAGVTETLALHASAFVAGSWSKAPCNYMRVDFCETTGTGFLGAAAGGTWYWMPANLFVSAVAGVGQLSFASGFYPPRPRTGMVGKVALGKEWAVGGAFGVGLAAELFFYTDVGQASAAFTVLSPQLALSTTFY